MAFPGKYLVDIPDDKGIHIKSAGAKGEKYIYKYVKYYRNAAGEPRNQAKAIGKLDPASGRMIPNRCCFELDRSTLQASWSDMFSANSMA